MRKLNLNLMVVSLAMFGFSFIAAACSGNESGEASKPGNKEVHNVVSEASKEQKSVALHDENGIRVSDEEARTIMNAYLKIKEALVGSNASAASNAATEMLKNTKDIDGGEAFKAFRSSIEKIAKSKDIAMQRKLFSALSGPMAELAEHHNVGMTIYKQYCPMALNHEGAFWLSEKEEIFNPYFGDRMLHCGSVKEVIGKK